MLGLHFPTQRRFSARYVGTWRNTLPYLESIQADPDAADAGSWYAQAREYCHTLAREYNLTPHQVAWVVAYGSINNGWASNKVFTHKTLDAWARGRHHVRRRRLDRVSLDDDYWLRFGIGMRRSVGASFKVLAGLACSFGGPKVADFQNGFETGRPPVVVDRWMGRAWMQSPEDWPDCGSPPEKYYRLIQADLTEGARLLGMEDYVYQAQVWTAIRRSEPKAPQGDLFAS